MYQWHFTRTGDRTLPPLLLLHGWMGSSADYTEIIDRLKSQFDCIAIDLPGHGKTEVIDEYGYGFVNTAIGIIQLLDSLTIDCCSIAGYSFGGRLALYLALEFPDRCDRVMLESTSPGLATDVERQARVKSDRQISDRLATDNFSDFVRDWYQQSIFVGIDKHPHFPNLIHRRIATNQPLNLAKSLKFAGLGMQPYLGERLKISTRSILLIVGKLDRKFVSINRELHQRCPHTNLKIVPSCSHNVHFQNPQTWSDYLNQIAT
ncbi:2-succinyl-6-hydroxy-2,4-cyclohexadiene-1-carboxylate synthase [Chamaesiphon sp.]|uniref:2-succinyl-6-hydroxy-2, 4-cyclohexadiene-1-carboxylate synthase n=1 Tax=Chamaesiphon sp. TaxID=2814140 RepID=UPI003593B8E8